MGWAESRARAARLVCQALLGRREFLLEWMREWLREWLRERPL